MTSKRSRDPSSEKGSEAAPASLPLLALLLSVTALLFTACGGTLEVGFASSTAIPGTTGAPTLVDPAVEDVPLIAPRTPTPVPDDYVLPTPQPAFTPIPSDAYPAPAGLRVAFVKDGDICLWTAEETEATGGRRLSALTSAGNGIDTVKISDDGEIVAFRRGDELWKINSDGTSERQLLGAEDFDAMETEPAGAEVRLNRFEWVPGTHTLAFNTRLRLEARDVLADDLRLVDADTLEQSVLLAPGEGGQFHYSPDGSQIAVVTTGDISLIDVDGGNRRDSVLTYTRVAMYSEDGYYVQPTWAADGSSLMVAIPPADPHAKPVQPTTIWRIPTDGTPASLITDIAAFPEKGAVAFSHGLTYVAYVELPRPETTPTERGQIWLKVVRLENGDWAAYPICGAFYGWAPNSRRFAFLADTGHQTPQLQIGQYSGTTIPGSIDAGTSVHDVRWVDADHYLFLVRHDWELGAEGDSWDLVLGDVEGSSAVLATTADFLAYDFARTPIATPTPIAPERAGYPPETRTGIQIVDVVIEAVLANDLEAERELIHYTTTGCTTVSGLGGPPKCRADEAEGTPVEVFPVLGVEGRHVRREDIDRVFLPGGKALYAVYHVPADAYEEDYYPAGKYGVVFVHNDSQRPHPMTTTFHVGDNGIVRVVYSESPTSPLEMELGVKVEEFILPPFGDD